ncbi:MAG TPA: hypothetical protein PLA68_02405 [Panacibacter sp.]|nr:hypothetical protein [Panacibacter sp.]
MDKIRNIAGKGFALAAITGLVICSTSAGKSQMQAWGGNFSSTQQSAILYGTSDIHYISKNEASHKNIRLPQIIADSSTLKLTKPNSSEPGMQFGLWIQDRTRGFDKTALAKLQGITVYKTAIVLNTYNSEEPDNNIKAMNEAGITAFVVATWDAKSSGLFVRDTVSLRDRMRMFLAANKGLKFIVSFEDEVATNKFFVDDMQLYLKGLSVVVNECHKYGIQATNSGDHLMYALMIANGEHTRNHNEDDVLVLLSGYKNIPIDFVNLHNGSEQSEADFKKAIGKIKELTGKDNFIMSAHVFKQGDPGALAPMIKLYRDNGFKLFMPFDNADGVSRGASGAGFHLLGQQQLTDWGNEYKRIINE